MVGIHTQTHSHTRPVNLAPLALVPSQSPSAPAPQFQGQVAERVVEVPLLGFAKGLHRFFDAMMASEAAESFTKMVKNFNLSLSDLTIRTMTLGLYIPQTIMAFQEHKHPIETLSRNVLMWTGSFALNYWTKNDYIGFPGLLNGVTRSRAAAASLPDIPFNEKPFASFNRWVSKHVVQPTLGMKDECVYAVQDSGIGGITPQKADSSAFWSKWENKEVVGLTTYRNFLHQRAKTVTNDSSRTLQSQIQAIAAEIHEAALAGPEALKAAKEKMTRGWVAQQLPHLNDTEFDRYQLTNISHYLGETLDELKALPIEEIAAKGAEKAKMVSQHLQKRLDPLLQRDMLDGILARQSILKNTSSALQMVVTAVLLGQVAMWFVFNFFAPMDPDFVDPKKKKAMPESTNKPGTSSTSNLPEVGVQKSSGRPDVSGLRRLERTPMPAFMPPPANSAALPAPLPAGFFNGAPSTHLPIGASNAFVRTFNPTTVPSSMGLASSPPEAMFGPVSGVGRPPASQPVWYPLEAAQ